MQVNKRANENLGHSRSKKYKANESSVAEAALKFEKAGEDTEDAGDDEGSKSNRDDDANKDLNIDSELLTHQSSSYTANEDETHSATDATTPNEKDRLDEQHAQLSEQLTNYNALRKHQEGQRQELHQVQSQSQSQAQQSQTQSPPTSSSHQQSPLQSSTQILHQNSDKPLAGTEEWHRIRKDNHKEVERRRRENINAGIKELAGLLPTQDVNKSQILQRAIEYIKRLKENENNNIEKWTLEKLLTDQAVAELTASNEKLKAELERAYREVEHWKKACSMAKDTK